MKCLSCGKEISENTVFCNYCATKIDTENTNEATKETIFVDDKDLDLNEEIERQGFVVKGTVLIKYIGDDTTVTIPNNITEIEKKAFANSNIKHVRLGLDVKKIGDRAFENCTKLEDIYFMKGIKSVGEYAFSGCISLTTLYIFSEDFIVKKNAFHRCDIFSDIVLNGKSVDLNRFYQLRNGRSDIFSENNVSNLPSQINDEREQIISYFNLEKNEDIDVIIALKHSGRTDQEIRQYIEDIRFIKTTQHNTPYSYDDYLVDLIKIERKTPDAGSALARVHHYEHGRDPYNLPKKRINTGFDKFLSIVELGLFILIIIFVISILV